jgi:hypothetical protein
MSISSGSVVAFLKFLIARPKPLPISGNFLEPNITKTTTRMTSISLMLGRLMRPPAKICGPYQQRVNGHCDEERTIPPPGVSVKQALSLVVAQFGVILRQALLFVLVIT